MENNCHITTIILYAGLLASLGNKEKKVVGGIDWADARTPLPPLFPMEPITPGDDDLFSYISREIDPILDRALKEISKNPVLGGGPGVPDPVFFHYKPHNFRRWFDFCRDNLKVFPLKTPASKRNGPLGSIFSCRKINHGKEILIDSENFGVRIKRSQVEILNKIDSFRVYRLPVSSRGCDELRDIVKKKELQTLEALKEVIRLFGGSSSFKVLNRKQEDKIFRESAINRIPRNQFFHTDLFKKVYRDPAVEFYDPVSTVNYISSRAIEDISPEISGALNMLCNYFESLHPLKAVLSRIESIDDVPKLSHLIKYCNRREKRVIENFLFKNFSIS